MAEVKDFTAPKPEESAQTNVPENVEVHGQVRIPLWRSLLGWFVSDDIGDIETTVIKPAIKDLMFNVLQNIIYGSDRPRYQNNNQYRDYSSRQDFRSGRQNQNYNQPNQPTRTNVGDYKYAYVNSPGEAQRVIADLRDWANNYGCVTVGRFWDFMRVRRAGNPMEDDWGWYPDMLMNVTPRRTADGRYTFNLPDPVYVKM